MSSRTQLEREIIMDSGSPLRKHSTGQKNLRHEMAGYKKLTEIRRLNRLSQLKKIQSPTEEQYENDKLFRVAERVRLCCQGDYKIPRTDLENQMRYLRHHQFDLQWLKSQTEPIIPIPLREL